MKRHQETCAKLIRQINKIGTSAPRQLIIKFANNKVEEEFKKIHTSKKISEIFEDILIKPWDTKGSGKPEMLRGNLSGLYSRRINHEDRLVYEVIDHNTINIHSCVGHYNF